MKNNIIKSGLPIFALLITMALFQNCSEQKFGDVNREGSGDQSSNGTPTGTTGAPATSTASAGGLSTGGGTPGESAGGSSTGGGAPGASTGGGETGVSTPPPPQFTLVPGELVGKAGTCELVINPTGYALCNSECKVPGQERVCFTTASILCVSPRLAGSGGELRLSVCQ